MKHLKFGVIALILFSLVIALTGTACADQPVPEVPGVQGISAVTAANVAGTATVTDTVTWTLSNQSVSSAYADPLLKTENGGEVRYTTAYDSNIVSMNGITGMNKQLTIDTRNKVSSQYNVQAITQLNFMGGEGGNIVGAENLMLDGAGRNTNTSDRMLCPFASAGANVVPAYCNIVQAGSTYDLTIGSVTATADDRFVSNDASTPVVLDYNVNIKPYGTTKGQTPARGSVMTYIKVHIQEARGSNVSKAEDLAYSDITSANGRISSFTKLMSYSSQVALPQAGMHTIMATGDISPTGAISVPDGGSATFSRTYDQQLGVATPPSWIVDGISVPDVGDSYTFTNVVSDHTIAFIGDT